MFLVFHLCISIQSFTCMFVPGFSISVMKADEGILRRLDAPTKASAWPVGTDG